MSLPTPGWLRRKFLANDVAASDRSLSQIIMPSSLMEKATSGADAAGCAVAHAAFSASMIGPSGMRVSAETVAADRHAASVGLPALAGAAFVSDGVEPHRHPRSDHRHRGRGVAVVPLLRGRQNLRH